MPLTKKANTKKAVSKKKIASRKTTSKKAAVKKPKKKPAVKALKKKTDKKTKAIRKRRNKPLKKKIEMKEVDELLHDLDNLDDLEEFNIEPKSKKRKLSFNAKSIPKVTSKLTSKLDLKPKKKMKKASPAKRIINMYRSMALFFIVLTLGLLGIVFYFYFSKVTIIITPNKEKISDNIILEIYDKDSVGEKIKNEEKIPGVVEQVDIEEKEIYPATGTKTVGEEVAGKVVIVNNYSKNQPLVATTRLLSPDNKLFRINKTINVPAGGSVEVEIYADKPSKNMAIKPTKFTIPGLWSGLQDKIYAESKESFVYREKTDKYITQEDVDNALVNIQKVLVEKAEKEFGTDYKNFNNVIYSIDESSIIFKTDGEVGEKKKEFSASARGRINVVAFSGVELSKIAKKKLLAITPNTKELLNFSKENIFYNLKRFDYEDKSASISASFDGAMKVKDGVGLIDRKKIISLSQSQLEDYLDSFKEIAGYEIDFSPNFMKRVPNLVDRIFIKIKE